MADHEDIARYLSQKLDDGHSRDPDLMTEGLKNDIMETMLGKASEMFLLVALNIDAILGETSIAGRKKMLKQVATSGVGLDSVYAQTLQRIREQKGGRSKLGMEVLMWASHSERPLQIVELSHALAVDLETTDLDPENVRPQDTILGSCLGLAVVDRRSSTVRLIHYTLQEYLSRPGILPDAHKTLAEKCLAYLNYQQVIRLPADARFLNLPGMPFLNYSSLNWGSHAKAELSDRAKSLALRLLDRYGNHISATLLLSRISGCCYYRNFHRGFTGLHCASHFGIIELVAVLVDMKGVDINQRDCRGFTPLMWAAYQGNEGVLRLFLTRDDVNPDKPDKDGRTPLTWASLRVHEGVVRLLLRRGDVNTDKPDNYGQTPRLIASKRGHSNIVALLPAQTTTIPSVD